MVRQWITYLRAANPAADNGYVAGGELGFGSVIGDGRIGFIWLAQETEERYFYLIHTPPPWRS
jgi:hypothetical protein